MTTDAFVVDRGRLGRWYVLDVAKKLAARDRLPGARTFDELQRRMVLDPSNLSAEEALATRRVNSRLSRVEARWLADEWTRLDLGRELGRVARLEDCGASDLDGLADLITKLSSARVGVRQAKVTKVLALKRPALVPMLDSLVYWMLPGATLKEKLVWLAAAARAWKEIADVDGLSPAQSLEKVLWFDALFPWVEDDAKGTAATHLLPEGWRLVHWPARRNRGSASRPGRPGRDGCVVQLATPPDAPWLALDELAGLDPARSAQIIETREMLDRAADRAVTWLGAVR